MPGMTAVLRTYPPPMTRHSASRLPLATATFIASACMATAVVGAPAASASDPCPQGFTLVAQSGQTGTCEIRFTSSTTWTPPAGVSTVDVLIVGAGGGGGSGSGNGNLSRYAGAGGGGGQLRVIVGASPSGAVNVAVGVGGAGGVYGVSSGVGTAGGNSSFDGVVARGGTGGANQYYNLLAPSGGSSRLFDDTVTGPGKVRSDVNYASIGGGGGTGSAGADAPSASLGGAGGAGISPAALDDTVSTGLFVTDLQAYGGGGGGGGFAQGGAATAGGGAGGSAAGTITPTTDDTAATPGVTNLGGGGGGGFGSTSVNWGVYTTSSPGASGGSGVVALRITVNIPEPPTPTPPVASDPPRDVIAVAGDRSATASWLPPESSGSFHVSHYQLVASPSGATCLATTTTCTIDGLTNGVAYTFTVRALTGAGWSPNSEPSNAVTPRREVARSIVISGSRGADSRLVLVKGTSTGMAGERLTMWIAFSGQETKPGATTALIGTDGTFTWSRRTSREVRLYAEVGSTRSNTITISAR